MRNRAIFWSPHWPRRACAMRCVRLNDFVFVKTKSSFARWVYKPTHAWDDRSACSGRRSRRTRATRDYEMCKVDNASQRENQVTFKIDISHSVVARAPVSLQPPNTVLYNFHFVLSCTCAMRPILIVHFLPPRSAARIIEHLNNKFRPRNRLFRAFLQTVHKCHLCMFFFFFFRERVSTVGHRRTKKVALSALG